MMRTYSKIMLSILALFSIPQSLVSTPIPIGTNVTLASNYDAPSAITYPFGPMIAKGPNGFLMSGVVGFISANSNGVRDQQVFTSVDSFFNVGNLSTQNGATNPQLRFDTFSNRWFALAITATVSGTADTPLTFYLAVSNNDTLTGGWSVYTFEQDLVPPAGNPGAGLISTDIFDFATFGVDQNALYIGANLYAAGTSNFLSAAAFVVQKSSVLNGGPIVVNAFRNLSTATNMFAPVGVDDVDANPQFGYIIGTSSTNNSELILYRIINPGSATPSISAPIAINVALTAPPLNAPLKNLYGNLANVNIPDDRLQASLVRNHQLFTVHHIGIDQNGLSSGTPDRTGCRWTQLDLTGGGVETATTIPTVIAEGTLYDNAPTNPNFYYYPAIMTNDAGTMIICGSTSANNVTINAFASNRAVAAPSDDAALRASVQLLTNSNFSYTYTSNGQGYNAIELWGLFSRTCIDPIDNKTMWTIQQFVSAFDVSGYQVTELKV